jgi:hypothetical protein
MGGGEEYPIECIKGERGWEGGGVGGVKLYVASNLPEGPGEGRLIDFEHLERNKQEIPGKYTSQIASSGNRVREFSSSN